jgi:hypothetical protein
VSRQLSKLKGQLRDAITADPSFTRSMTKVMLFLLDRINGERFEATGKAEAWPSLRTISLGTGLPERTVQDARRRLKAIKMIALSGKGGRPWPGRIATATVTINLNYDFNPATHCTLKTRVRVQPIALVRVQPIAPESVDSKLVEAAAAEVAHITEAAAAASTSEPPKSPLVDPPPDSAALPGGYAQSGGSSAEPRITDDKRLASTASRLLGGCGIDRQPTDRELDILEAMLALDVICEDIEVAIGRHAADMIARDRNWAPQGLLEFLGDRAYEARDERLALEQGPPRSAWDISGKRQRRKAS